MHYIRGILETALLLEGLSRVVYEKQPRNNGPSEEKRRQLRKKRKKKNK